MMSVKFFFFTFLLLDVYAYEEIKNEICVFAIRKISFFSSYVFLCVCFISRIRGNGL